MYTIESLAARPSGTSQLASPGVLGVVSIHGVETRQGQALGCTPPTIPPMEILYQDEHFIAVNKPAGLLVHRTNIDRHEKHFALQRVRDRVGRRVFPVHRLDKPVSGVLLFALDPETARRMADGFAGNTVEKTYVAVVRGFTPEQGLIDYALGEQPDKMKDSLAGRGKPAQHAVTAYRSMAVAELPFPVGRYETARYSLLQITPRTGRTHQIRRHMKHIFHPVIGDTTHGDGKHNRFFREQVGCRRLLLSATRLAFAHPRTGAAVEISARLDEEFGRALAACTGFVESVRRLCGPGPAER